MSIFHILISEGGIDLFKYTLLEKLGTNICLVLKIQGGMIALSTLHFMKQHQEVIFKYIFDQVNEKNPTNDNGYTPFHVAANYESHFEI